jgi:hypothetical protein
MPALDRQSALGRSAGAAAEAAGAVGVAILGSGRWAAAGGEGWSGTVVDHAACAIGYQYDLAQVSGVSGGPDRSPARRPGQGWLAAPTMLAVKVQVRGGWRPHPWQRRARRP